ncbi:hypothetical protein Tsubulata_025596 [Turnera subulata]|uniref:BHLH domain-containing protein n=1 Tax=Turnera subulata TaxID=218843 RepID=A0A9Q0JB90_9ROSI|nr:hypothetical protein Tsubulata_025596 [Turnera subulata]
MNRRKMKIKMSQLTAKKKVRFVEVSVLQRNLRTLRRMIPGCDQQVDAEALFQKSIEHIVQLKLKVDILKRLLKVYGM